MKAGRAFLVIILALVASLAWAGVARAHALLLRSVPAADSTLSDPPPAIEMWFTEPLESTFTSARLLAVDGAEVETGAAVLDPTDPTHLTLPVGQLVPGIYTVAWQTLSQADGHEWYGSFPFIVLNPDGSRPSGTAASAGQAGRGELPTPGETVTRWLALLGGLLLFGAPLFRILAGAENGRARSGAETALAARVTSLVTTAVWAAAALLLAGSWGQLLVQALRIGGLGELPAVALATRTGALALARQVPALACVWIALGLPLPRRLQGRERALRIGLAVAAGVVALLVAWAALPDDWLLITVILGVLTVSYELNWQQRPWLAMLPLAAGALLSFTAISHAAAGAGRGWAMVGDYVHLLAAGAWIGGLLVLPWLFWLGRAGSDSPARLALWQLTRRYSYLASFSVFVLAMTGLFNSLVELPTVESLWNTPYGRVLLVKLALTGAALGIALLNNRLLHRRDRRSPEAAQALTLRRQVTVESAVSLGLVLSVAVLVQTPTPRFAAPATAFQPQLPFTQILTADDLYMHAQVSPNQVGVNRFWLHLYHETGTPIGEVQLVQLRFNYGEAQLGQGNLELSPLGSDTFAAESAFLSQAGDWSVSVYVRRRGMDDTLAEFSLTVPEPSNQANGNAAWANPVLTVPGVMLVAGVLLMVGLIPWLWGGPLARLGSRQYAQLQLGGAILLLAAFAFSVGGAIIWRERLAAQRALTRTNPIPDTAESIAQGQMLYQDNCLPCHGATGRGDGPVGLTLRPGPANLQVHMVPGVHADAEIFEWITNGFPNSPMPAFGEVLTEDERWHLMNYIRTLVPQE